MKVFYDSNIILDVLLNRTDFLSDSGWKDFEDSVTKKAKNMENKTFDLDDYIFTRKEKDSDFAKDFDTGYEDFKIGMLIKEMRHENRIP